MVTNKFLSLFLFIGFVSACMTDNREASAQMVIDRHTTEKELSGLITEAKTVSLNVKINDAAYNNKGAIQRINGDVEFPDGSTGSFKSDKVGKIIISQFKDGGSSIVVRKRFF